MGVMHSAANHDAHLEGTFAGGGQGSSRSCAFLDFRGLAEKLGATEQWVRRNVRPTYTRDPIPHLRFGRTIRFDWDSDEMRAWLERRKALPSLTDGPWRDRSAASYTSIRTGFGPKRKERIQ